MSQQAPGKGVGRVFMIVAWCAGLYLATQFFGRWEERQQNPNTEVTSQQGEGYIEVKLLGNAQGHFVASGRINNVPVEFLLDTGATDVAVPMDLARQLALPKGVRDDLRQRIEQTSAMLRAAGSLFEPGRGIA